jgi:molybdenum cofactor synthesis domain-containing protein
VRAAVLTASDRSARGEREDESGPYIAQRLAADGWDVVATAVVHDDAESIATQLVQWCDELRVDAVITTGGTGFAPRDVTPEATLSVVDRRADGLAEAIRAAGMAQTPRACLSRAAAGLRGQALIVNLPGSMSAVRSGVDFLLPLLRHAVAMLAAGDHDRPA